ncbi:MAG: hypothetical protein MZV70_42635 [Desulfobacterales bacterium]|nr:hypothetical protein [Desulfobacterales bacterium]
MLLLPLVGADLPRRRAATRSRASPRPSPACRAATARTCCSGPSTRCSPA